MNLELPFYELPDAELDVYLGRIDEQLDVLFLDEVRGALEAAGAAPAAPAAPGATASSRAA